MFLVCIPQVLVVGAEEEAKGCWPHREERIERNFLFFYWEAEQCWCATPVRAHWFVGDCLE